MTRRAWPLAALAAGCGNLLGLSPPQEQRDAPASDAPLDAGPAHIAIVTGGTAGSSAGTITSQPDGITCPGTCAATFPAGTQVTLTASAAGSSDDAFTGFHGGPCSGSASACTFTAGGDATIYARYFDHRFTNVIFASSTQQAPGAFDSASAADALCTQLGSAAGVPGPLVAWLSTSTQRALQRLDAAEPPGAPVGIWVRVDGKRVFTEQPELIAGEVEFPPRLDELGRDVGDDALAVTGTTGSGSGQGGAPCQDWASTGDPTQVLAGEPVGGTGRWSSVTAISCATPARVYCLSLVDNGGPYAFTGRTTVPRSARVPCDRVAPREWRS